MKLHLSDIKLEKSTFSWKLNGYPFNINYHFPVNETFIPMLKLMPIIQLSCEIASLKNIATVTTDVNLTMAEKLFIRKYVETLHPYNINLLENYFSSIRHPYIFTINGEDITGNKYFNPLTKLSDMNVSTPLSYEKDVISSWSGGKDSLLSILILEDIGCNVFPGTTKWNTIAFNRGAAPFMEAHKIKPFYTASMALGNKLKNLTKEVILSEKINTSEVKYKPEFDGDIGLPMTLYHSFYMQSQVINNMAYALHKNIRHVFCGDEYGVNTRNQFYDSLIYSNIGQSILGKNLVNLYLNTIYTHGPSSFSVLFPLHGPAEVNLLINKYGRKDYSSCLTMIGKYCNRCAKCVGAYLLLQALGKDPEQYGLNKKKLLKEYKAIEKTSMMFPNEQERIWLIKRNFNDKELSKILQDYSAPGVTDSMFSPLKPEESQYKTIPRQYRKKIVKIYKQNLLTR